MAVVIPVEKLVEGFKCIMSNGPIFVQLRDTTTSFSDKKTGWKIVGSDIKELPEFSPGRPSQHLFSAIRAGRFVRVVGIKTPTSKGRKRYEELVESIVREYDDMLEVRNLEGVGKPTGDGT